MLGSTFSLLETSSVVDSNINPEDDITYSEEEGCVEKQEQEKDRPPAYDFCMNGYPSKVCPIQSQPTSNPIPISIPTSHTTTTHATEVVNDTKSCNCKKCICDSTSSCCCCLPCMMNEYCMESPVLPYSTYTLNTCQQGCEAPGDDSRCCCWIFTPIAFVFDIVLCPCYTSHYAYKKYKNGKGIPCYHNNNN